MSAAGKGAAGKGLAGEGASVLICDCDGVLIDSEAVAADVIVQELGARWPGVDARPAVMPLLGLRIERVLAGAADALGRTLSADDVDAIR
ncbi:HAD family phosphatase, partial [Burkholderia dolosa]|nr:HAD family phosphatase [Burkholderia dolosa]